MIPFAVVGSERTVIVDGKTVRGRKTRWGVVNVEDEAHCEFVYLRNFLTRWVLSQIVREQRSYTRGTGHTCKTSSRRPHRSITRRSAQNNCSRSRSRPAAPPRESEVRSLAPCKYVALCSPFDTLFTPRDARCPSSALYSQGRQLAVHWTFSLLSNRCARSVSNTFFSVASTLVCSNIVGCLVGSALTRCTNLVDLRSDCSCRVCRWPRAFPALSTTPMTRLSPWYEL